MATQEFSKNEQLYLDWVRSHPDSFVVNVERSKNPNNMVLHHAWCKQMNHLHKNAAQGGFTERQYIKICAPDLASLQAWVRQNGRPDGTFSTEHPCYM